MQYYQLLELVLDASHATVMLYGPFTVRRRFVGAVGDWSLGGGGGGSGRRRRLAEAPATKTKREHARGQDGSSNGHGSS